MTNLDRYADCREILDRALESKTGLKLTYASYGAAVAQRRRLHTYRALVREANSSIYPPDHPMHSSSVYDVLTLSILSGTTYIEIHRGRHLPISIEELPEITPIA